MDYNPTLCDHTGPSQGDYRFVLEQPGARMLLVIGLNPSTAGLERPDPTLRKVLGFARRAQYDGFAMLNLSSERQTDKRRMAEMPDERMHRRNLDTFGALAERYPQADILVAFGNDIEVKPYLKSFFRDIYSVLRAHRGRWKKIGEPTLRGNPRHPLYARYDFGLTEFDVGAYIGRCK